MLSARDLVRQIPAEWQENVKHRRTVGYRDFLDTDHRPAPAPASWPPGSGGCRRSPTSWTAGAATLPPEHVHLVTVPKPGAARDLLWERFAEVLGLDAADLELETDRANPSLGVPETALVRRINQRVNGGVLAGDDYRQFVRELLAHRTLSRRVGLAAAGLPDDVRAWAVELSESWIEELAEPRVRRRGLARRAAPRPGGTGPFVDPDDPDEARRRPTPRPSRSSRCCARRPGCRRVEHALRARPRLRARRARPRRAGCGSGSSGGWCAPPTTTGSRRPAWRPTAGCGAAARGRRSDRSARST